MRYSYGIVDRKQVLAYRPQLFQRTDDLLIFPSKEFVKWHGDINELLDGIYQINAKNIEKGRFVDIFDLNLAVGLLININYEMENLIDPDKEMDFSYHYISTMDEDYKKRKSNLYSRYMYHVDRKVLKITPQLKYKHMMEIVEYACRQWKNKEK